MRKITRIGRGIIVLSTAMLFFTSCIELTEKVTVNPDGSGKIELKLDMGSLASALNSQNTGFDVSLIEKIRKTVREAPDILKDQKGIRDVISSSDDKNGVFIIRFCFDRSANLNKAVYLLMGAEKQGIFPDLYKITRHKVRKKDLGPFVQKAMKNVKSSGFNDMFYSVIYYNNIIELPSAVKSVKNIKSKTEGDRTISTRLTFENMIKGHFSSGNLIRY